MNARFTLMSRLGLAEPLVRLARSVESSNRHAASKPTVSKQRSGRACIFLGASVAALAVPTAAMAAPDGHFNLKYRGANENASSIGVKSSAIKQNGQFISGNGPYDQTTFWT